MIWMERGDAIADFADQRNDVLEADLKQKEMAPFKQGVELENECSCWASTFSKQPS